MRSLTELTDEVTAYGRSLADSLETMFPTVDDASTHRRIAASVQDLIEWTPGVVAIAPTAGSKPCQTCGRTVGGHETRFKVLLPPQGKKEGRYDSRGNPRGLFVGIECVEEAKRRILVNWPQGVEVDGFLMELESEVLPRLRQLAEVTDVSGQLKMMELVSQAVRRWAGWPS